MNAEQLLELMGEADEHYVADAIQTPTRSQKSPLKKFSKILLPVTAAAAGVFLLMNIGGSSGSGGKEGLVYDSYAGPIFPLAVDTRENVTDMIETDEETPDFLTPLISQLTITRDITLDFSPYESRQETRSDSKGNPLTYETYDQAILVTDQYTLTNPTDQDITIPAIYPFAGRMDQAANTPVITVDGIVVDTSLAAGTSFVPKSSFSSYEELLADGSYLTDALDGMPATDLPVTVYRLTDYQFTPDTEEAHPVLQFSFQLTDPHSSVLAYEWEGGFIGQGSGEFHLTTKVDTRPHDDGTARPQDDAYVILVGEDIPEYTLQAFQDSSCTPGEERSDLTATVVRTETTLGEILYQLAAQCYPEADVQRAYELLAGDLYADGVFGPADTAMYGYVELDSAIHDLYAYYHRVQYLRFDVTIPAGESITLSATARKEASFDHSGSRKMRNGYDVATQLGSCLTFTEQTATIAGYEHITIIDQNFGFDLRKGITTVTLDPKGKQYWIQVRK